LSNFTPYGYGFGLTHGDHTEVFQVKDWNLVPLICFEDTVPHLVRGMVATAQQSVKGDVDCLINLTNDGWFVGSSESEQHLITAQFRCIETRTPMARAVNTGISAVIDGDGLVREPVTLFNLDRYNAGEPQPKSMRDPETGEYWREMNAALVVDVPLDPRSSLYVWWGDWFAGMCLVACSLVVLSELVTRVRRRNAHAIATPAQ
jgi:apolipoprotein N-acyltransferase